MDVCDVILFIFVFVRITCYWFCRVLRVICFVVVVVVGQLILSDL
jgi:hypothetical protein